eukprot:COSAG01_NODE_9600_length_2394_cov_2.019608_2_plen_380_part_00
MIRAMLAPEWIPKLDARLCALATKSNAPVKTIPVGILMIAEPNDDAIDGEKTARSACDTAAGDTRYDLDGREVPLDTIFISDTTLGDGQYTVKRGIDQHSGEALAVKICVCQPQAAACAEEDAIAVAAHKQNMQELRLLASLRGASPFLLHARGGCVGPGPLEVRMLLPLMEGGNLMDLLTGCSPDLLGGGGERAASAPEGAAQPGPVVMFYVASIIEVSQPFPSWNRFILTEISLCHACSCQEILRTETAGQGLAELHRRNIVHMDIKPENILLDGRGYAAIADLGASVQLESAESGEDRKFSGGTWCERSSWLGARHAHTLLLSPACLHARGECLSAVPGGGCASSAQLLPGARLAGRASSLAPFAFAHSTHSSTSV